MDVSNFVGFSAVIFATIAGSMRCQALLALPAFGDVFSWLGGGLMLIGSVQLLVRHRGEARAVQDEG